MSERIRGSYDDAPYKSTYILYLFYFTKPARYICERSHISVLTGLDVEQLRCYDQRPYQYAKPPLNGGKCDAHCILMVLMFELHDCDEQVRGQWLGIATEALRWRCGWN